jgi:hypothetical protein
MCVPEERLTLLLEIAHCPSMVACLNDPQQPHPCAQIVGTQLEHGNALHQIPEPWNGDLCNAPVLFISSNPSISAAERYPDLGWPNPEIATFFQQRFGNLPTSPILSGRKVLNVDNSRSRAVPFLSWVRCRVAELTQLPRNDIDAGVDYVVTEVVHCKSVDEIGVEPALIHCAETYTERVLNCAGAAVVIFVGGLAASVAHHIFQLNPDISRIQGPVPLCGIDRMVVFLPHPNSHKPCKFETCCDAGDLANLRAFLAAQV